MVFIQVRVDTEAPQYDSFSAVDEISLLLETAIDCKKVDKALSRKMLHTAVIRYLCLRHSGLVSSGYIDHFENPYKAMFLQSEKNINAVTQLVETI